ncbi:signal peptidase II [Pseudomaricurvus sp.]|uniref:signal peptidase II n=1 Tax=Pseudomaricurvus sp. TaxID=2004510 RepID=UPI003F6CA05D
MMVKTSVWKWYGLAILVIALDQISKHWVSATFTYGQPWVITDFFNFTLLHNKGAAFSFLSDAGGWQRWFFGLIAGVVSVVLVVWMARVETAQRWMLVALALVLGGAIGNLYDRVVLGYVVDFIVVHYQHHYWPAFNIADSAICVGAGMLIVDSFRSPKKDELSVQSNDKQI